MAKLFSTLLSLGLGAGAMYYLDPQLGTRRRGMVRDQAVHLMNETDRAVVVGVRDLQNRMYGVRADAAAMIRHEQVSDLTLEERVRSRLGFLTSHPKTFDISVHQGQLTIGGEALRGEVNRIIFGLGAVHGIKRVINNLVVYDTSVGHPTLEGAESFMEEEVPGIFSGEWSPGMRLVAGAGGGLLALYGLLKGGILGLPMKVGGAALLVRAITNVELAETLEQTKSTLIEGTDQAKNYFKEQARETKKQVQEGVEQVRSNMSQS